MQNLQQNTIANLPTGVKTSLVGNRIQVGKPVTDNRSETFKALMKLW